MDKGEFRVAGIVISMNYVCVDLNEHFTQISYYNAGMKEPVTLSGKVGSSRYLIPTAIQKKIGLGQWFFADETVHNAIVIDHLLERALKKEEILCDGTTIHAESIFLIFIRKLLTLSAAAGCSKQNSNFVFTIEKLDHSLIELLAWAGEQLDIPAEQFRVCSYEESFAHYVMNQDKSIWVNEVMCFEFRNTHFKEYRLLQDRRMKPVILTVESRNNFAFEEMEQLQVQSTKDELFFQVLQNSFNGRIVSGVYLVGEGFEGDWMIKSKQKLCQGRRVFAGQNLFSKGGCYYGLWEWTRANVSEEVTYLFLGEQKSMRNFGVIVQNGTVESFLPILNAGENWQDAKGELDLILESNQEPVYLIFVLKDLKGKTVMEYRFDMDNFPLRPCKASRIQLKAWMNERQDIHVRIEDRGFGTLFSSSNRVWEVTYEQMDQE